MSPSFARTCLANQTGPIWRGKSDTAIPVSACFSTATIRLTENLFLFMANSSTPKGQFAGKLTPPMVRVPHSGSSSKDNFANRHLAVDFGMGNNGWAKTKPLAILNGGGIEEYAG